MLLQVSGVTRPSSGGSAQLLFGVIACLGRVLTACRLQLNYNQHALNTHPKHAITPNNNCAEPPEDGLVTPETCKRRWLLPNKLRKVYQVGSDSLIPWCTVNRTSGLLCMGIIGVSFATNMKKNIALSGKARDMFNAKTNCTFRYHRNLSKITFKRRSSGHYI
jgi:hypothetical protein